MTLLIISVCYTQCAFRTSRMTQKFLEAWSNQFTCTEMHSRNDSIFVDWSGTTVTTTRRAPHSRAILCHFVFVHAWGSPLVLYLE